MFYWIIFIAGFIVSFGLTFLVRKYAIKHKLALAIPRERDVHTKPIPRLGGVAIFCAFWLTVGAILIFYPEKLIFVNEKILGVDENLCGLFIASLIWLITGIIDDVRGLPAWVKLLVQFICGVIIVAFGIQIWWISNHAGGLNIVLNSWTYLLVPFWIVLMMNVTNWLDGVDGLSSSISLVTLLILFFLSIDPAINQNATAMLCIILAGCVLGFLPANWNPAKIFLGDTGSGFLGLMLGTFAIISGAKLATAALVMGIPILDTLVVIIGRLSKKKSIFSADKTHLHHRFLDAGFNPKQIVIILSMISLAFGLLALKLQTQGKMTAFLWLLAIMGILLVGLSFLKKKRS